MIHTDAQLQDLRQLETGLSRIERSDLRFEPACSDDRAERPAFGPGRPPALNWCAATPAHGPAMRDIRRRAPGPRTYTRPCEYGRNNGFPSNGRYRSMCSSTRQRPMGIALAPEARLHIRLPGRRRNRRHSTPAPPAVATGTKSPTERARARARKRSPPTARRRPSPGSHGIAPGIAARSDRRSFPPPWHPSIGSRIVS